MTWPTTRPVAYDPALFWDETTGTWVGTDGNAGGRYKCYLIAIGQDDSGDGIIYYGEVPFIAPPEGATLMDSYNTGYNGTLFIYDAGTEDNIWAGQTFTASDSYDISSVKLLFAKEDNPGTITISIRETTTNLPSGSDLCVGTTNGDTLTTDTDDGEWREITFSSPVSLVSGTVYAIVVGLAPSSASLFWLRNTSGTYVDGRLVYSSDRGVTWDGTTQDFMFETYGTLSPS